ncbi:sigma-70 family RNA polymerase sigma factor [Streptomyces sp. NPDC002577]
MTVGAEDGIDGCGPDEEAARWHAVLQQREALIRIARPRTATVEDAEDVVQEAMIRAVESYRGDTEGLAPWLMRVTVRLCADTHRQRIREHRRWSRLPVALDLASFDERVCDRAEAAWAAEALSRLPARQARALRLRAEGLTVSEVAGRLGVGYRTAESLLARARSTLKALLASALGLVVVWWRWVADSARLAPAYPVVAAATTATAMVVAVVIAPESATVEPAPHSPHHLLPGVLPAETTADVRSIPSPSTSASPASVPSASATAASDGGESADKGKSKGVGKGKSQAKGKAKGKPADTGKPAGKGRPTGRGKPAYPGKPADKGRPTDRGKPPYPGKPAYPGEPADKGRPTDPGIPTGQGKPADRGGATGMPLLSSAAWPSPYVKIEQTGFVAHNWCHRVM